MSTLEKNWQVLPKIDNEFIEKYPEYNRVVLQLLFNRGLIEKEEIEEFLNASVASGTLYSVPDATDDPFLFRDMEGAVELVIKHIKSKNKIVIYGDYDADGVTASAVLFDVLTIFKAEAEVYIPDRVSEGYGLNKDAITEIEKGGAKLIITVDGGIRSKEEVEFAKSSGLDVIITDHHVPPAPTTEPHPNPLLTKERGPKEGTFNNELPDCLIINPLVEEEKYPFKFLAGVGVAFKLAQALIFKSKLEEEDKKKLEERILDLVAVGTVADCVSLLGENRILVKRGLEILNNTRRVGLQELIKVAQINNGKKLDSWNIGFQIGPRLNAAGRMEHANTALELLITKDKEEAETIARRLNSRNQERQEETERIVEEIEKMIAPTPDTPPEPFTPLNPIGKRSLFNGASPNPLLTKERGPKEGNLTPPAPLLKGGKVIVAVTPDKEVWNEGVVGLVAGRICERYYLPTLVITKGDEGYKGSGRSIAEFNIMEALEECKDLFLRYGGHPMACGFSLEEKSLEEFKKRITEFANKKLKDENLKPVIKIEAELGLDEIDEKFVEAVEQFAPFGQGNDKPKFVSFGVEIADIMTMGVDGKHIKLRLRRDALQCVFTINAIGFGQAERWQDLKIGDKIDIVYYLEINEFNGRRDVQFKIIDIKQNS